MKKVGLSTLTLLTVLGALLLAGCGGDSGGTARTELKISAASSLKQPFEAYAKTTPDVDEQFSFAGSDELAAQIRAGAKPDIYAAANTKLPAELYEQSLVVQPTVFATNRLVIAVPAEDAAVDNLSDLTNEDAKIAAGAASVPVGSYTRKLLARLPADQRKAILANFVSNEPDVASVAAKVAAGAADAGFVYATDVKAAKGKLRAIELPDSLQPEVEYGIAPLSGTKNAGAVLDFIEDLLRGAGADALVEAGFGRPRGGR